jgi:group I intron endonuclease
MDNPYGVIYKLTSPSGKVYVGQTTDFAKRMRKYANCNCAGQPAIYQALRKYGWDSFKAEQIMVAEDKEWLDFYEEWAIIHFDAMNPNNGYNLCAGGNAGGSPSEETRLKLSVASKGVPKSAEHNANVAKAKHGCIFSTEHRARLSAGQRRRKRSPLSAETKARISASNSNQSKETRDKRAASVKASWVKRRESRAGL